MRALGEMRVTASVEKLLDTLRTNREQHVRTVKAAREVYIKRATKAVEGKLARLREGKAASLAIRLSPPLDYTREYDVIITMLELHTEKVIELDATQVRGFVMDDWGWKQQFVSSTNEYLGSSDDESGED